MASSLNTVLSYPIPAYQNVPINAQYYIPSVFIISAIALGITTVVTTTVNVNYVIGQQVRLIIPYYYGSKALNEVKGYVISLPSPNSVQLNINSNGITAFISPSSLPALPVRTLPQILAIGDVNTGQINEFAPYFEKPFIPGSFINISPY